MRKNHEVWLLIMFCFTASCMQAQNFEKMLAKGKFHTMQRALESNLANNPDDVKSLYFYSRYYKDTLNPAYNLYSAYQKAVDAYSVFDNKLNQRHKDRLAKDGITKEFLKDNIIGICNIALQDVNKNPSLFKYQDYLTKYKYADNNIDKAMRSRDSFELKTAEKTNTEEGYRLFIEKYPNSVFMNRAMHLRDKLSFDNALSLKTVEALDEFMAKYPNSEYRYPAKLKRDSTAFVVATNKNTEEGYEQFISRYPDAPQVEMARTKMENVVALNALSSTDMKALDYYLRKYPTGRHAKEVQERESALTFNEIKTQNTITAYTGFMNSYPQSEWSKIAFDSVVSITRRSTGVDGIYNMIKSETDAIKKLKLWNVLYETYVGNDGRPAIESFEKKYPENPLADRIAKDKEIYK
jgi:hypothetical protein